MINRSIETVTSVLESVVSKVESIDKASAKRP